MHDENQKAFERGVEHGIAIAMLSAGLPSLRIDRRAHALWSYTKRMRVDVEEAGEYGARTYKIEQ